MANHLDCVGQQVGDYRLLRWLGGGGFGEVYLAEQVRDHSQVAIKLLRIQLNCNEELKAFINEARTVLLKHVHIVPLLDFGIGRGEVPFLVMEYATQGTLRDRHPRGSQVPLPLVVNYVHQVASALQYAHEQRLIHRDVKPQNMLLREDGTVLLSDFGLVAVMHNSDSLSPHQGAVGTLAYMAPEQLQGQAQAKSDQYSLAVVVYEWIAGSRPFEGTAPEIMVQQMMKPPPSLGALVPGLSRAVEEVILKALAKDPKDRFVSVQAFATALEQAVQGIPVIPDEHKTSSIGHDKQILPPSRQKQGPSPPALGPLVDWGEALTIPTFYGREQEMALLTQWIVQVRCRVVSVLGIGGIGKSALAVSIMHRLSEHFEVVIFRSLRDAPAFEALLDDCLQILSPQLLSIRPSTLEHRLNLLLEQLRKVRVLIVLDNLERLLQEGNVQGHLRPGFEGYGQLLRRVAETAHQSCLLSTSREKPAELRLLVGKYSSVRTLRLTGLDVTACQQLLLEKALVGTQLEQEHLIQAYAGNPLALKIVAETIVDLFGGEIGPFLASGTVLFGSINDLLEEHFARLSPLEQSILCWLAIMRESVTLQELLALLVTPLPRHQVLLEAVDSLHRRGLIERGKRSGSFTLQSVVLEYVTAVLIADASREVQLHQLDRLILHGFSQAHAKEYVRQTQEQLFLSPLLAELQHAYPIRAEIERQLLSLLNELREKHYDAQGYGPANLIALLRSQRGHLSGLDLSQLSIRGAYLQSIQMHDTQLLGSLIRDTIFTEAVSATWAVTISQDGRLWAASGTQGEVRIWEEGGRTLHQFFQAHTSIVTALAFSPNGQLLASGSIDGTVKLWDVEGCRRAGISHNSYSPSGALLWVGWHHHPHNLAFSLDSSLLACAGLDATVRVFDTKTGMSLQNLEHPAQAFAAAWSPDGSVLASTCFDGELRLWEGQEAQPSTSAEPLQAQPSTSAEPLRLSTSWKMSPVWSLAFAPDGKTLACADVDQKLTLWEAGNGRLLHTFEGETSGMNKVVWSPDGRTLASCSYEKAIWLFDVEQRRHRATLHGHTSDINGMAFTPDSGRLLSSSNDGTLRVWDVESGQCVRVMEGYAVSLYDLDWSPDGTHLVSGGTDGVVTIWDMSGGTPPRELRGHTWLVYGVGWSPDGKLVASGGFDGVLHLWNPTSLTRVQISWEPSTTLAGMAWNPDGSFLAIGSVLRGMYVWDVREDRCRFVLEPGQAAFLSVAWSPDGCFLAGGSEDGSVYLWESADGTQQQKLLGHHGDVMSLAWSPDGQLLVSGSGRGELLMWDIKIRECMRSFAGHPGMVSAVVWTPCGDCLVSGSSDGKLYWWDVESAECVSKQAAHQGAIRSLRTSPDGKRLASCGDDGAIRIWDMTSHAHLRTLRRDRLYERLNITGIRGLNEVQKTSLQALGAIEEVGP